MSWTEPDSESILPHEWLAVIQADPELTIDLCNGQYFAVWNPDGEFSKSAHAWFDWDDGNIYTSNPDAATLVKLRQLAQILKAKIQGDDGETY